jgi:hypothetical protein
LADAQTHMPQASASKGVKESKPAAAPSAAGVGSAGAAKPVERKKKTNMTDTLMKRIRALSRKQSY